MRKDEEQRIKWLARELAKYYGKKIPAETNMKLNPRPGYEISLESPALEFAEWWELFLKDYKPADIARMVIAYEIARDNTFGYGY